MKVFIAGLKQESNTFNPDHTDRGYFERGYVLEGRRIPEVLKDTNSEIWGFYEHFRDKTEYELVPGFAVWSIAHGPVLDSVLEEFTVAIKKSLRESQPVDGILISLHGALVSESREDCDGYILKEVRKAAGDDVPISVALDYHTIFTQDMVDSADALCTFRTYPHIEFKDTGIRAAKCLETLLKDECEIRKTYRKLPMIVPVENSETESGPMVKAIRLLEELDQEPSILSASLCCSQPWIDARDTGISIVLCTDAAAGAY